ncbi:MAG: hypothetical protein SH859_03160 [Hyphomicrobium aestuarii]|nr:hypothetical protein [Hyphomicrobium aestuarii]
MTNRFSSVFQATLPVVVLAGFGLVLAIAASSVAMEPAAAASDAPGRFTMSPTDGGMLKLDTATGAVSFCTRAGSDWACTPVKDSEKALRDRIAGLEGEIVVLKEQLKRMDDIAGIGDPDREAGKDARPGAKPTLPTEKDVEQAFDYLERMMKTIRERMQRLEGQEKRGTPL